MPSILQTVWFFTPKKSYNFAEYVKGKINVTYFVYLPLRVHLTRLSPVFKRKDKKRKKTHKEKKREIKGLIKTI